MLDDPFYGQLPDGERPDIMLYIFPHLLEFVAIDLRDDRSEVWLLNTAEIFNEVFFDGLEMEFSKTLREGSEFPFAHMINLPLQFDEVVRGVAMSAILERLGVDPDDEEELPTVIVFIISSGAMAMHSERLVTSFRDLMQSYPGNADTSDWESVLARLVSEENDVLQKLSHQELSEAMRDDSPDYFTLWENRN